MEPRLPTKKETKEILLRYCNHIETKIDKLPEQKVTWWDKVQHWFNGKKTGFGIAIGAVGQGLRLLPDPTTQAVGWIITGFGAALGLVGGGHKVLKARTKVGVFNTGEKGTFDKKEKWQILVEIIRLVIKLFKKE